jgi:beta-lactamase regulating signal transducer with metallopeptidase domain
MSNLIMWTAHNTLAALVLACFVYVLSKLWRQPPIVHALWLLVLLRLLAPPVLPVGYARPSLLKVLVRPVPLLVASAPSGRRAPPDVSGIADPELNQQAEKISASGATPTELASSLGSYWRRSRGVLPWLWLAGAGLCALLAVSRIVRFERSLKDTLPAPDRLQALAHEIARKLGIRRPPEVRCVEFARVPFLWSAGLHPVIVMPLRLAGRIDEECSALILAHELAHLRRRDHWVRALELLLCAVYWWNPLAWLIRTRIHHYEELCCDAWVRWLFPKCAVRYAELVLCTAEQASAPRADTWLTPLTPFLRRHFLKARIEMILESRSKPKPSKKALLIVALLGIVALPPFIRFAPATVRAASSQDPPPTAASKPETPPASGFPYVVQFEQGATRFLKGDEITILEIHGTSPKLEADNLYMIKGRYTLASHPRATVAAYVTARDRENGTSASHHYQTVHATEGQGTFTLFLPMSYRGWPHVSFYPAEGGSDFGGNYFGTGDSLLKKWWGSN